MNKKGMSMISLVVIIIVTLILVGIATTAGYRYITQVIKFVPKLYKLPLVTLHTEDKTTLRLVFHKDIMMAICLI